MQIYANLCKFMQMSCDVIGHVMVLDPSDPSTQLPPWRPLVVKMLSTNQKVPKILPLSNNRGLYGGASSGNKRTTNQNAPFQISTNQNEPQNLPFLSLQNCTHTTKIATSNNKFQMASGQGSHWLIESPTIFSSMCIPPFSDICQFYFYTYSHY